MPRVGPQWRRTGKGRVMPALTAIRPRHLLIDRLRLPKAASIGHGCLDVPRSEVLLLRLLVPYPGRCLRVIGWLHVPLRSLVCPSVLGKLFHLVGHAQTVLCNSLSLTLSAYPAGAWGLNLRGRWLRLLLLLDTVTVSLCFRLDLHSICLLLGVGLLNLLLLLILAGSKADVVLTRRECRVRRARLAIRNTRL